jgi:hypothetical protein
MKDCCREESNNTEHLRMDGDERHFFLGPVLLPIVLAVNRNVILL